MTKCCKQCSTTKPVSDFGIRIWGSNGIGYHLRCKDCMNARRRELHDKDKNRNELLKARFGIDLSEYNQMFIAQNGCCAICEKPQSAEKRNFSVDHDHKTGIIRGLLCENCNRALGQFKDSTIILDKAKEYLTKDRMDHKIIPLTTKSEQFRRKK